MGPEVPARAGRPDRSLLVEALRAYRPWVAYERAVLDRWITFLTRLFVAALALWVVASAILGIPHGPGHSIESLSGFETLRDIAFPIWLGSVLGVAFVLGLELYARLSRDRSDI